MECRQLKILLVDDDPGDAELIREALQDGKISLAVKAVTDGDAAMRLLRGSTRDTVRQRPDLILLDLNLPNPDGRNILASLKADPMVRAIPVIVMSTSDAESDIAASYDLGASCYVVKPAGFNQLVRVLRTVEEFWARTVRLPKRQIP